MGKPKKAAPADSIPVPGTTKGHSNECLFLFAFVGRLTNNISTNNRIIILLKEHVGQATNMGLERSVCTQGLLILISCFK